MSNYLTESERQPLFSLAGQAEQEEEDHVCRFSQSSTCQKPYQKQNLLNLTITFC